MKHEIENIIECLTFLLDVVSKLKLRFFMLNEIKEK